MDSVKNKEIKILRENQKEVLEIKNTVREMKNAFDRRISRLEVTEERLHILENINRIFPD